MFGAPSLTCFLLFLTEHWAMWRKETQLGRQPANSQTKRCYFIEENKPAILMQAVPQNQADITNPNIENY